MGEIRDGYRVKVSLPEVGVYISGWTVRESDKTVWWVQPPASNKGGKWYPAIEFDKNKELWKQIETACIVAVEKEKELYESNSIHPNNDEPLDLSAIPE